jgi:hypothetical protein
MNRVVDEIRHAYVTGVNALISNELELVKREVHNKILVAAASGQKKLIYKRPMDYTTKMGLLGWLRKEGFQATHLELRLEPTFEIVWILD